MLAIFIDGHGRRREAGVGEGAYRNDTEASRPFRFVVDGGATMRLLLAGGFGYRYARLSPLWSSSARRKRLLCFVSALVRAIIFSAALAICSLSYILFTGSGNAGGPSQGAFSSRSFE